MKKSNINNIALILLIVKSMLTYSSYIQLPNELEMVIELLCYGVWVFSLLKSSLNKKYIFGLLIVGVTCIVSGILVGNYILFSSFMLFCICLVSKHDEETYIKTIAKTLLVMLIIHSALYAVDLLKGDINEIMDKTGRIRYSLGFTHPNIASYYSLWCYLGFMYVNRKNDKKNLKNLLGIIAILIVYLFTKTNTVIIIMALSNILFYANISKNLLSKLCKYSVVALTILLMVFINCYKTNNKIGEISNDIFSNRIYYSLQAQENYGYTLIGHKIDANVELTKDGAYMNNMIILDVGYANLLYRYGIIFIIYFAIIAGIISKYGDEYQKKYMIIWAIFAMSESIVLNMYICFSPIFAAFLLSGEMKNDRK